MNSYSSVLLQIDIEDEFTHHGTIDRCDPFQQVSQFCICRMTHFNKCPNFIFVAWAISTSTTVLYFVSNSGAHNHIHCLCIREGEKKSSQLVADKILLQKSLHMYKKQTVHTKKLDKNWPNTLTCMWTQEESDLNKDPKLDYCGILNPT